MKGLKEQMYIQCTNTHTPPSWLWYDWYKQLLTNTTIDFFNSDNWQWSLRKTMKRKFVCAIPDKVVDDDIWDPEVLDDVGGHIDLASRPVGRVIQNHPEGKQLKHFYWWYCIFSKQIVNSVLFMYCFHVTSVSNSNSHSLSNLIAEL